MKILKWLFLFLFLALVLVTTCYIFLPELRDTLPFPLRNYISNQDKPQNKDEIIHEDITSEPPDDINRDNKDDKPVLSPKIIEGLVRLDELDDGMIIEMKYATPENFVNKAVYPFAVAVINYETGKRLVQANEIFKEHGYKIKIWDAYRPIHVQKLFWEAYPDRRYVSPPPDMTKTTSFKPCHTNGMSVDITLVDMNNKELEMPSEFDDFSEKASASYPHMSQEAKKNVNLLIEVMERVGFKNYSREWWHFNDIQGTPMPYLDISLEQFIN